MKSQYKSVNIYTSKHKTGIKTNLSLEEVKGNDILDLSFSLVELSVFESGLDSSKVV